VTEERLESQSEAGDSTDPSASAPDELDVFGHLVREVLGELASDISMNTDELQVRVGRDQLVDACRLLKDAQGIDFKYLRCLSVVDWEDEMEVVYHLSSLTQSNKVVVKVRVNADDLWLPTVMAVWAGADWHEREGRDLFGLQFRGHPNMTPLILYDGFEGFPGRKSYAMPEQVTFYGGD
jgi:NADH-quinone oxidoreductase subunit C